MVFESQRVVARQMIPLRAELRRRVTHADVVHQRAADQAGEAGSLPQRGAEEPRRDHRGPDSVLEPARVLLLEGAHLFPDGVGEADLAERVGDLRARVGRTGEVLQRSGVERFQHRIGDCRVVQRAHPRVARRARGRFLQVREIDDLSSRSDQLSVRRDQVAGEHGAGQGELAHA